MANIGMPLTAPELGWQRFDNAHAFIVNSGFEISNGGETTWNKTRYYSNKPNTKLSFNFYGTSLRIISVLSSTYSPSIVIEIDGLISNFSEYSAVQVDQGMVAEFNDLKEGVHWVQIYATDGNFVGLDAIDINSLGRLLHPDEVIDPKKLTIGKRIRCHYQAIPNTVGSFSGLGKETSALMPVTSSKTPNGDFYYIMVDERNGKKILLADRNIQHSITWNEINKTGIVNGISLSDMSNWVSADNNTGLVSTTASNAYAPSIVVFKNQMYIAWHDATGTKETQIRVQKWDGSAWVSADNGGTLNYSSSYAGRNPMLFVFNEVLYVTWSEVSGSTSTAIRVKKWNGSSWVTADNNGALNFVSTNHCYTPSPVVFQNQMYIFFAEYSFTTYKKSLRAKKWNGTGWVAADNNLPLNFDRTKGDADEITSVVFNNELYVTWMEKTGTYAELRVKKFTGTSWETADNNIPLNYALNQYAYNPVPFVFNDELYMTWYERDIDYQIRVKKWDGSNWVTPDMGVGINSTNSYRPQPVILNNELVMVWTERTKITVKKWNGSTWVPLKNSNAINTDSDREAQNVQKAIVFNNELVVCWTEYTPNTTKTTQIRVKKYVSSTPHPEIKETLRLFTGGNSAADKNNEWDAWVVNSTLNGTVTPKDNNVWNPGGMWSPASNTATTNAKSRTHRGYTSGDLASWGIPGTTDMISNLLGFRPVLEVEILAPPNQVATIDAAFNGLTLVGSINDPDNDKVRYRILVNGVQKYPTNNDFTEWTPVPFNFTETFSSSDLRVGEKNTVVVEYHDEFSTNPKSWSYDFVGEYVGLMFMDNSGNYYSTDKGDFLKYLEFGTVVAGEVTEAQAVKLVNKNNYQVHNVTLSLSNLIAPELANVQLSKLEEPFTPVTNLDYSDVLNNGQEIVFYVRVSVDSNASPGKGKFDIDVVATPVS